ncbi:hypothetical protein COCNU_06G002420 [Cocos nucifera]|uniref:PP2A regulatory subunit TAP46 n=1 Tax=Cocos nucifera TaxID=13894 RepID=A0A8K0I9V7_COCNU|nr:hypothetical protein COCNU_06G002420 [Cocos nucifera]
MGESTMEEMSLPALFEQARKIHSMATESSVDQETLRKGIEALRRCDEMVSKLGLFSSNETKDDVSTANLKYLLVPFYLGELTEKVAQDDRMQVLKISQDQLKEYISICEALELAPKDELETFGQEGADTFAARRAKKAFDLLDMLKREEEMLLAIKEKQSKEFSREILDERTKRAETWHRNAANRAPFLKPADPITCATFAQDVIEGRANVSQAHEHKHQPLIFGPASLVGGRLTSERERLAAQVFQPGYRLPTMSIEEAGLREMEMMNKWQERNAKLMEEANSSWHRDGTGRATEDEDAEVGKARAWDDWKDDHPRGAGNKKLTPCG